MKNTILRLFCSLLCMLICFSCNRRDPNPELSDAIYSDLNTELDIAQKNLLAETTQNTKVAADVAAVVPQTGQQKYAKKRYFESVNSLDLYKQQVKYFEISLELRKREARARYLESLTPHGRAWPDAKEIEDYRMRLKLQKAKLNWGKKADTDLKKIVPYGTPEAQDRAQPEH